MVYTFVDAYSLCQMRIFFFGMKISKGILEIITGNFVIYVQFDKTDHHSCQLSRQMG